jgi:hypothetical protein
MKKLISIAALLGTTAMAPTAFAQDVSVSTSVDYVTEYIFRGAQLGESSIQPGVEVSVGDFTVGGWFSTGIGENSVASADEFDLYAGYSFAVSDLVGLDVGVTYYHYPQGGSFFGTDGGNAGTYEVYAGASFDTTLSPSVYAYYDLTIEAFTLEGGLGHSFAAGENTSFDLGLTAGLVDGDGFSYEYGQASASLGYSFTDDVSAYVSANYALASEDNFYNLDIDLDTLDSELTVSDNTFWLGIGVAAGF